MSTREFTLPDPGEGLVEAEIVTWHVAPGDTVEVNQVVLEIETAKSLVELPIPWAGTVGEILVPEGETVEVGTPIVTIQVAGEGPSENSDDASGGGVQVAAEVAPQEADPETDSAAGPEPADEPQQKTLVGYGPVATSSQRRPRRNRDSAGARGGSGVLASPPVRLFAKERGVDLSQVQSSRADGVIERADVEAFLTSADGAGARQEVRAAAPEPASQAAPAAVPDAPSAVEMASAARSAAPERPMTPAQPRPVQGLVDERLPIKGVRKVTAAAMVSSAFSAPHVTEFLTVDMTRTMELVKELARDREFRDIKVTPLLVVAKACLLAMRREPYINALWDEESGEIHLRSQVNLGIAAATDRGLLVPNIKNAGRFTMAELGREIGRLVDIARHGKPSPAVLNGGTFTISNIGVFGVDAGTPIIKPGESAILAVGTVRPMPWVVENADGEQEIAIRQVAQLSLSFDHRIIDGDVGSRFLATVGAMLENPARAMAWG